MNNSNKIIGIVLFILSLACFASLPLAIKVADYTDRKNQSECEDSNTLATSAPCGAWDGTICRKGKISGNSCVAKGSPYGLILIILGVIFLILAIVFFFFKK